MYVHYCTCIVHILVWTYLFLLTSFFDCLSFCGLFLKHPYKRFFPFYILYFYLSRSLSFSLSLCLYVSFSLSKLSLSLCLCLCLTLSFSHLSKSIILSHSASSSIILQHVIYHVPSTTYTSQKKKLPLKMKPRLVIIVCAGYSFRQLFLWQLNVRYRYFLECLVSLQHYFQDHLQIGVQVLWILRKPATSSPHLIVC